MESVCSLPSIDHMTSSKPVTSPINRGHKMMSESKGTLPPLSSVLLRPTPQHNLSEIQRESPDSMKTTIIPPVIHEKYNSVSHEESKQHQQQQHILRANSPFSASHSYVPEQLNSPGHRTPQNSGAHSSQRSIAPDVRLPSIKHFENIQQSPPPIKQFYPQLSQTANMHMHMHPQPPPSKSQPTSIRNSPIPNLEYSNNTFSHSDLPPQSPPHLAQNSTMWTRPQTMSHSPRQYQSSVVTSSSQKLDKPIQHRFVSNHYSLDYNGSYAKDNAESNVSTQNTEKTLADMQKITEHCTIISQFATQYGDYRSQANKFGPLPSVVNLEQQVSEMINRTYEILNVLNVVKSEIGQTVSNDQDTINLIRTKRTTVGPSATRTKYRKRSKRAAPPGRCHSCNISETPEWRRGPDGARTLCNACGLHFAKLTRKRALSAMQQHQPVQAHKITRTGPVLPSILQQPIVTQTKSTMGILGGIHLTSTGLQSTQMMQSPTKRLRPDTLINHQISLPTNGNYLKA